MNRVNQAATTALEKHINNDNENNDNDNISDNNHNKTVNVNSKSGRNTGINVMQAYKSRVQAPRGFQEEGA